MILAFALLGCAGPGPAAVEGTVAAAPSDGAECAVCGMVVDEQPGPRGQVVRVDGTREFYCSLGDLRAGLAAPSPHGSARASWVEPVTKPGVAGPAARWSAPETLTYVVGYADPMVMGRPALAVGDPAAAASLATELDGWTTSWAHLLATPFSQDPPRSP